MRIVILHIIALLFAGTLFGQSKTISLEEMAKVMQESNSIYKQSEFFVQLEVATYKGHFAVYPEDKSKGYVHKKNGITEQYLNHIYSIQNKELKFVIDSGENLVGVSYPDTEAFDFVPDAEFFTKYEKYISRIVQTTNKNGSVVIDMMYKAGMPYEKISIRLVGGFAKEVTFYYAQEVEYEDKTGKKLAEKPKLSVKMKILSTKRAMKFSMNQIAYKSGSKYQVGEKFKGFELMDFRYQN